MPQINNIFKRNEETGVAEKDPVKEAYVKEIGTKIALIDLQTDLFDNIAFPSLPNNFEMLMSDIEYPDKAKKNPNGSLFMKPREIDRNSANDIALQCFGGTFKNDTLNPNPGSHSDESLSVSDIIMKMLLEDTPDPSFTDGEISVEDLKARNDRMAHLNTTICRSIDNYIKRSVDVIKPILEMVGGGVEVKKVMKTIEVANLTSWNNVKEWLDAHSDAESYREKYEKQKQLTDAKDRNDLKDKAKKVSDCILISLNNLNDESSKEFIMKMEDEVQDIETAKDLNIFVKNYCRDYSRYEDFDRDMKNNHDNKIFQINLRRTPGSSPVNASLETNSKNKLFEDSNNSPSEIIDYDKIYDDMYSFLTNTITEAIGPRTEWSCLKNVKELMQELKKRVDVEIPEKIKLVCKTDPNKKTLIRHPFKQEGLLSMWDRYSKELDTRIENRYNQLTGNGSVETGSAQMVEDFLRTTYPAIIAMMLVYKCVFAQLARLYKGGYIPGYTKEDYNQLAQAYEQEDLIRFAMIISLYDTEEREGHIIP